MYLVEKGVGKTLFTHTVEHDQSHTPGSNVSGLKDFKARMLGNIFTVKIIIKSETLYCELNKLSISLDGSDLP